MLVDRFGIWGEETSLYTLPPAIMLQQTHKDFPACCTFLLLNITSDTMASANNNVNREVEGRWIRCGAFMLGASGGA